MRLTRLARLAPVAALLLAQTACGGSGTQAGPDLGPLATALGSGNFGAVTFAGGLTPAAVAQQYATITSGLGKATATVSIDPATTPNQAGTASAQVHWRWTIGAAQWGYATTVEVTKSGGTWAVDWSPAVVYDGLSKGDALRASSVTPRRGDIIGAGGQSLVTERPVVVYGIDKSKVPAAKAVTSAQRLARLLGIDPASFAARVKSAGAQEFVDAITYRQEQAPAKAAAIGSIPGARAISQTMPLAPTKEFAAALLGEVGPVTAEMVKKHPDLYRDGDIAGLSGLEARYDQQLRGTPGIEVDKVSTAGADKALFRVAPVAGKPLRITLDERLQTIAESLLAGVKPASALVAIQPSTGKILAAANGPGANGVNIATYGQAPPGSTFKTADSLALLRAGLTPTSTVPCTPHAVVDGKVFSNDSWYPSSALGQVPLKLAVAQSCNTAMVNSRDKLRDVASAAASLGFGVDHETGFPSYFGQIPAAGSETERAADLIGQGRVLASPMVMAAVIASIQAGHTVVPSLVTSVPAKVAAGVQPITAAEDAQLKTIFRYVVQVGTGHNLADVPGAPIIAKTGTAEFDRNGKTLTHAWMIAAQGDLAVAVYVDVGTTGSGTAGPILESFLRQAR